MISLIRPAMKIVGFLLVACGGLLLLLAGWYAWEATSFFVGSESARGEIVEHKFTGGLNTNRREVGSSNATVVVDMYAPIVRFETPGGTEFTFQAGWSESEPPPIGTEVGVRYPERAPQDARVAGIASLYGGGAIVFVIGAVFAAAGGLVVRKTRR